MRWLLLLLAACSYEPPGLGGNDDDQPADAMADGPVVDAPATLTCPSEFESFGGTTFYLIRNDSGPGKGWKTSEGECEALGAGIHLAAVDTEEEADQLALRLPDNREYWVGMVQLVVGAHEKDEDWKWITGGDGLDHWAANEPNDGDNPPNPIMNENDSDQFAVINGIGQLADKRQEEMRPLLCECDGLAIDSTVSIP